VHTVTITTGQTATVYVQDVPQYDPVAILLRKVDAATGQSVAQGDTSLANAEFTIKYFSAMYDVNPGDLGITPTRQWVLRTDSDGYADLNDTYKVSGDDFYYSPTGAITLPLGTVTIQETKAPEGYLINPKVFVRQITSDGFAEFVQTYNAPTIPETVKSGTISLIKFTNDGNDISNFQIPEEGAEFQVYLKSAGSYDAAVASGNIQTYDTGRVDATGNVIWSNNSMISKQLAYGTYIVHQTSGWEGRELVTDFEVEIKEDTVTNHPFILKNPMYQTTLTVNKTDAETGKLIVQTPAKFKILNLQTNEYVSYTTVYPTVQTIDEFETTNGTFTLPVPLVYGDYELIETQAPAGYQLSGQRIRFSVGENPPVETIVNVPNTPLKGKIELAKTGLQFTGIQTGESEFGTVNKPVFSNTYLANTTWNVIAKEDIIGGDGVVKYPNGTVVDTITTTATGPVTSKDLPLGKYALVETATAAGYNLNTKEYPVDVINDGAQLVSVSKVSATNEKASTQIDVLKTAMVWQRNENGDIISRKLVKVPGEGFTFGLYTNEAIRTADGTQTLEADSLIAVMVTDENGKIQYTDNIPFGSYYTRELAAPEEHYNLSETKYLLDVTTDKTDGQTIIVKATEGEILNDFDKTEVIIKKTDLVTAEPVADSLVEIRDTDGNVIYRVYTGEDGVLPDIILEPGNYVFEEMVAPKGYIRNKTVFEFTVNPDGTVDGVTEFTNEPTKVVITKTDFTEEKTVPGAEIVIRDEDGNEVFRDITDENGEISTSYLEVGKKYTFEETIAPDGYAINTSIFEFEIDEDGNVIGDTSIIDDVTKFTIHKVDDQGNPLAGVEFTVYDVDGNEVMTVVTDENGIAVFSGFKKGEYTLKETKTVDGFDLAPDSIKVIHDNDMWDNDSEGAHITVVNYPHVDVPKTGDTLSSAQLGGIIGGAVGAVAVMIFFGCIEIRKRKKQKNIETRNNGQDNIE